MKASSKLILSILGYYLISIGTTSSTSIATSNITLHGTPSNIVPNSYLLEFNDQFEDQSKNFIDSIKSEGINYKFRETFNQKVFNGVSIRLDNDKDISKIEKLKCIKNVWPVVKISRTESKIEEDNSANSQNFLDSVGFTESDRDHSSYSEVKVGIIDTGIDYKNPALGGCFKKKGCKVQFGFDLVGDDFNGSNEPKPDDDPLDECSGYGTHVAGIIAGEDSTNNITGIAPKAKLGAYRIFGCNGTTTNEVVIKAMEKAFEDGMNIINLSLMSNNAWFGSPESLVAEKLTQNGIFVVAPAGDSGDKGIFEVSSPSTAPGVISVASVDAEQINSSLKISAFSSYGPTNELDIKPDIAAPGKNVKSIFPVSLGSFKTISGTSVSTSFVTGALALYMQNKEKSSHKIIRNVIQNNAKPITINSLVASTVLQQGSGLISLSDALYSTIVTSPSKLVLNDSAHFNGKKRCLTLTNIGKKTTKFTFNHLPAQSINGYDGRNLVPANSPITTNFFANVKFSKSSIRLRPGESRDITLSFTPPEEENEVNHSLYSGYIIIMDSLTKKSSYVPYMGMKGCLESLPILDNQSGALFIQSGISDQKFTSPNDILTVSMKGNDIVLLGVHLAQGTKILTVDVIPAEFNGPPTETRPKVTDQPTETQPEVTNQPTKTKSKETDMPTETQPKVINQPAKTKLKETDKPTVTQPEQQTETPKETVKPTKTSTSTDTPTGNLAETPSGNLATGTPTGNPTENPTNTPTETPTGNLAETPTETPTGTPTETPTGTPAGVPAGTPAETPTESPTQPNIVTVTSTVVTVITPGATPATKRSFTAKIHERGNNKLRAFDNPETELLVPDSLGTIADIRFEPRNDNSENNQINTIQFDGKVDIFDGTRNVELPNGQYRLFLAALRPFGDPKKKKDWETFTSSIIEIKRE